MRATWPICLLVKSGYKSAILHHIHIKISLVHEFCEENVLRVLEFPMASIIMAVVVVAVTVFVIFLVVCAV